MSVPSNSLEDNTGWQHAFYLLLSPSWRVMFLLKWMLLLQPLLEPNGENGSGRKKKGYIAQRQIIISSPWIFSTSIMLLMSCRMLFSHQWRPGWTAVCLSSPAAPGPGPPDRSFPQKELWEQGRGPHSTEGWSWCSRFQPQTAGGRRDSAKSLY